MLAKDRKDPFRQQSCHCCCQESKLSELSEMVKGITRSLFSAGGGTVLGLPLTEAVSGWDIHL